MNVEEFVRSEVELYQAEGHNKLLAAAAGAIRCEQYVDEIVRRHATAAAGYASMSNGLFSATGSFSARGLSSITDEQQIALTMFWRQGMLLHLEIESFYMFAKVLLDRTAQLMHWWFADTRAARGVSLQRHSEVVKNLDRLVHACSLTVPDGLGDLASSLQQRISDYRDHDVAHDAKHAFPGTLFDGAGNAKIVKVRLGAGVTGTFKVSESGHIEELDELRVQYVDRAMQFLISNRDNAKLVPLLKQRGAAGQSAPETDVPKSDS